MKSCVFCSILSSPTHSFLYEDEHVFIIPDKHPQSPYHVLIIPKKHYENIVDIPDHLLMTIMTQARRLIEQQKLNGFRLVHNGYLSAQIGHFHLHVIGQVEKYKSL